MRILVVNDDGIESSYLETLVKVASRYGFVYVSAPIKHQSATSHGITISNKIYVDKESYHLSGSEKTIAVDGFPADCVRVGVALFDTEFDLVIAGVNAGFNISSDHLYSGTVAAAREAVVLGIPGLALSTHYIDSPNLEYKIGLVLEEVITSKKYLNFKLLNVNIPRAEKVNGIKYTTQGRRLFHAEFSPIQGSNDYKITYSQMIYDEPTDTDAYNLDNDYIVITPLTIDQTNYEDLKKLRK
ncbi:MAG TPA: 5'/3'-nucleotidase SurE [Acholeplasmataceae bacterium]|mgnify:CR=1 FL=1|jgi:5'-nucleotidase|nr:5'/3'-nucleotidase SurE [Acholeplasmataceae bacterium]